MAGIPARLPTRLELQAADEDELVAAQAERAERASVAALPRTAGGLPGAEARLQHATPHGHLGGGHLAGPLALTLEERIGLRK
jgi:hypothetical protein